MRLLRFALFLCITSCVLAQTSSVSQQEIASTQQLRTAFTSNSAVASVSLNGTFTSTEGSLSDSGAVRLSANVDGTYSLVLNGGKTNKQEGRELQDGLPSCWWLMGSEKKQNFDFINCQNPAWFLPSLQLLLSSKQEWMLTATGENSEWVSTYQMSSGTEPGQQAKFRFESVTHLLQEFRYELTPETPNSRSVNVSVTYDDYRQTGGVMIPFHVTRSVNGTQVLEIKLSDASVQ